jgi:hypothetical protein
LVCELSDNPGELLSFPSRHPFQSQPFGLKSHVLQHDPECVHAAFSLQIAIDIVAIARVTSGYEDSIGSLGEAVDHKPGGDHLRAHDADKSDIGRVLIAACTGQICTGV